MRKRTFTLLLIITVGMFLSACSGNKTESSAAGETFSIVETIPAEDSVSDTSNEIISDDTQESTTDVAATSAVLEDTETMNSEEASSYLTESDEANPEITEAASAETVEEDVTGESQEPAVSGITIVLDPGHSSKVSGNMEPLGPGSSEMKAADSIGTHGDASGLMEYQLNLTVCQKAAVALEQKGYKVILTREDSDTPISCAARAQIANNANADAFIRVHANGADATSANGAMTICITSENPYTPETYEESSKLSETLLDAYCSATGRRKERVWYTDSMTGNNWSKVPTTLLEMGYMTNHDEDLWMASEEGQEQIVDGIVKGIDAFFGQG